MPVLVGGRIRPPVPPNLSANMRKVWNYIVDDLMEAGLIDHADAGVIEAAAVFWGTARDARAQRLAEAKEMGTSGLTENTPQGRVENRLVSIERNSWMQFRSLAEVMPLSPWGRARLGLRNKKPSLRSIADDIGVPERLKGAGTG
jgi:P27 family predicted phage terminase small subunit